jgi:hypothetical protein
VEYSVGRGELRAAEVRLRNWDGESVELEVEKGVAVRQRERRRSAGDRTWALELRRGVTGRFRLTLTGSVSLEEVAAGVPMPEVSVPGTRPTDALLMVAGPDLAAEGADGLTGAEVPSLALKDWPREAERLRVAGGQVWKVAKDEWALRLRPRGGAGAGPVRVLLAEHTAAVADGRHWLHEAVYWVQHGANTDLNVVLPKPGTVVAVAVDGTDVAPLQPARRRLWLPLPGRAGVRAVRVRWRYDDPPAERLDQPLLETPRVEGSIGGPGVWTVYVPAGFESVPGAPAVLPGAARAAAVALYRAEAQLRASAALTEPAGEGGSTSLAVAQQRFYAFIRQAGQALQLADGDSGETGPDGKSLPDWQRSLSDENRRLAREHAFEETRAAAERQAEAGAAAPRISPEEGEPAALAGLGPAGIRGPLPDLGTPAYLCLAGEGVTPALTLRPREERRTREALADSAGLLGLLLAVGALALLPRLAGRLQPFWPEPLLALGALAWYRSGLTPVAAVLLVTGVAGRLVALAGGVRRLLRRRPQPPPPSGTAQAAGA